MTQQQDTRAVTWDDHQIMAAVEISQAHQGMLEISFDVTILERDFNRCPAWTEKLSNVIIIGQRF